MYDNLCSLPFSASDLVVTAAIPATPAISESVAISIIMSVCHEVLD